MAAPNQRMMKRGYTMVIKSMPVAAAILGLTVFGSSGAFAKSISSPDGGSYVFDSNSQTHINVKDAKCDSKSAYGNWNGTDSNRIENNSGCGTTVWKSVPFTGAIRACTDYPFSGDSCSRWY